MAHSGVLAIVPRAAWHSVGVRVLMACTRRGIVHCHRSLTHAHTHTHTPYTHTHARAHTVHTHKHEHQLVPRSAHAHPLDRTLSFACESPSTLPATVAPPANTNPLTRHATVAGLLASAKPAVPRSAHYPRGTPPPNSARAAYEAFVRGTAPAPASAHSTEPPAGPGSGAHSARADVRGMRPGAPYGSASSSRSHAGREAHPPSTPPPPHTHTHAHTPTHARARAGARRHTHTPVPILLLYARALVNDRCTGWWALSAGTGYFGRLYARNAV